ALPDATIHTLNTLDTFALTMAMTALGIETRLAQIRAAGPRALGAGLVLYVWLIAGGFGITWLVERWLG
ncbi:putative sulfate exporter family transporter, partial [Burkholderia gladioli]|nr:putative sulfate exporter family transporter [Burkholderia gladioli]